MSTDSFISGMDQQADGYVPVSAMMQMPGMNGVPAQPVALAEPVKEAVKELLENNLELSDKPLSDDAMASLSAMFSDDEED